MHPPLRVAILECDEPVGETKKKYGNFGTLFQQLLEAGARRDVESDSYQQPELICSRYDVVKAMVYPELESVDAVLLSGSRYDSFSDGEDGWIVRLVEYIKMLLDEQTRVRVIGVCFGHQVIARALGVMPTRSHKGWEVAVTPVQLTDKGKQIFGLESLAIHQMHRDIVPIYPPHIEIIGYSSRCYVQGMYIRKRLLSLQGHPEFNGKIADELLELRRGIVLDEETYGDGKRRVHNQHDGVTVGVGFVKFLLED